MKRNFIQVREFLANHFPEDFPNGSNISGENYPVHPYAYLAQQVLGLVQVFAMASVFMGEGIWRLVPFVSQPPEFYYKAKENPMLVAMILFLIVPSIVNSVVQSGAFEVELDGVVVYSKLETGRMPSGPELLEAMTKAGLQKTS